MDASRRMIGVLCEDTGVAAASRFIAAQYMPLWGM
jgi:hypothetical protein